MKEKQMNYLEKIKKELQDKIDYAERRKKEDRKNLLIKLQNIVNNTVFETKTFFVLVDIYKNYGFSNTIEWQHYIWQNTVSQQHPDFQWIKKLGKEEK